MISEIKKYTAYIQSVQSDERFEHSVAVAEMCEKLAKVYGEDPQKAYFAGILHDIRKEADKQIQKEEMQQSDMDVTEVEKETAGLWHAVSGAEFCKTVYHITDSDILNAIRFHTVARAEMSPLEKIVYIGDKVSMERDFPDVKKYRGYALDSLDNAMYQLLKFSINRTLKKNGKIPHFTFEAYNYYADFQKG